MNNQQGTETLSLSKEEEEAACGLLSKSNQQGTKPRSLLQGEEKGAVNCYPRAIRKGL